MVDCRGPAAFVFLIELLPDPSATFAVLYLLFSQVPQAQFSSVATKNKYTFLCESRTAPARTKVGGAMDAATGEAQHLMLTTTPSLPLPTATAARPL